MIRSEYFDNELAKPPLIPKLRLAPKKSISSLKSSFEIVVVPFPSILPIKLSTPAFSPVATGSLSIRNE